jgi:hypothetical protein
MSDTSAFKEPTDENRAMNAKLREAWLGKPLRRERVEPEPDERPGGQLAGGPTEGMTPDAGDFVSDNLRAALRKARGYS